MSNSYPEFNFEPPQESRAKKFIKNNEWGMTSAYLFALLGVGSIVVLGIRSWLGIDSTKEDNGILQPGEILVLDDPILELRGIDAYCAEVNPIAADGRPSNPIRPAMPSAATAISSVNQAKEWPPFSIALIKSGQVSSIYKSLDMYQDETGAYACTFAPEDRATVINYLIEHSEQNATTP